MSFPRDSESSLLSASKTFIGEGLKDIRNLESRMLPSASAVSEPET
jgi:hypothetical protein